MPAFLAHKQKQLGLTMLLMQELSPAAHVQSGRKGKLARLATLQPEDSAEQLSNSNTPVRLATATRSKQGTQSAAEAPVGTSSAGFLSPDPAQLVSDPAQLVSQQVAADLPTTSYVQSAAVQACASVLQQPGNQVQELPRAGPRTGQQPDLNSSSSPNAAAYVAAGSLPGRPSRQLSVSQQPGQAQDQPLASTFEPERAQHAQQVQQEGFDAQQAQHVQQLGFETDQAVSPAQPEAATSQSSRPDQSKPGDSVYAARDLTVLEQYEADVVAAYASSFVAQAMMQQILPAAANAVADLQHQTALAEVRKRNAKNKQCHLEEVKAERAAWQEHEDNIKRYASSSTNSDINVTRQDSYDCLCDQLSARAEHPAVCMS